MLQGHEHLSIPVLDALCAPKGALRGVAPIASASLSFQG